MKTTIELPDELFRSAKQKAALQKTTLKALIERALVREIYPLPEPDLDKVYEIDSSGIPLLKGNREKVTSELVYQLAEESEREG